MDLSCCHGNSYDVTTGLKILPDKRGVKICNVSSFHEDYNNYKPFRAILTKNEKQTKTKEKTRDLSFRHLCHYVCFLFFGLTNRYSFFHKENEKK